MAALIGTNQVQSVCTATDIWVAEASLFHLKPAEQRTARVKQPDKIHIDSGFKTQKK